MHTDLPRMDPKLQKQTPAITNVSRLGSEDNHKIAKANVNENLTWTTTLLTNNHIQGLPSVVQKSVSKLPN
jgi:hypothetical protein